MSEFSECGEFLDESGAPEESTGDAGVDAVVQSLSGLDDQAVADHVASFERAHESLRRALGDAGRPVTQDRSAVGRS